MGPRRPELSNPFCDPGAVVAKVSYLPHQKYFQLTAMKIYHNSYACLSGPSNGLVQISKLSLNVWFARQRFHGPVSNRYADVIQTSTSNLEKVIPCDPGFPMSIQTPQCFVMSQDLAEGVFILHLLACCPWLKNGRGDPRFEDKPSAQVHGANCLSIEVEIDISRGLSSAEGSSELRIFVCKESGLQVSHIL